MWGHFTAVSTARGTSHTAVGDAETPSTRTFAQKDAKLALVSTRYTIYSKLQYIYIYIYEWCTLTLTRWE